MAAAAGYPQAVSKVKLPRHQTKDQLNSNTRECNSLLYSYLGSSVWGMDLPKSSFLCVRFYACLGLRVSCTAYDALQIHR